MPRKPATAEAQAAPKKKPGRPANRGAKNARRSPYEIVNELKARRDELAKTYEERLAKLDARIQRLEERHEKKIKVTELLQNKTPEELAQELEAIKKQQAILKKAMKQASKA